MEEARVLIRVQKVKFFFTDVAEEMEINAIMSRNLESFGAKLHVWAGRNQLLLLGLDVLK